MTRVNLLLSVFSPIDCRIFTERSGLEASVKPVMQVAYICVNMLLFP
jgi:hypothetical protein